MAPTPLANGGSNSTISDQVIFLSHKLILGMKFLNQMVSVYCKTIHCLFILNVSYISYISRVLVTFHLIFMR